MTASVKKMRAFPMSYEDGRYDRGMELRDWFAGQALAGLCAAKLKAGEDRYAFEDLADRSWQIAIAMMRAREGWADQ